jgi:hypothetical protein
MQRCCTHHNCTVPCKRSNNTKSTYITYFLPYLHHPHQHLHCSLPPYAFLNAGGPSPQSSKVPNTPASSRALSTAQLTAAPGRNQCTTCCTYNTAAEPKLLTIAQQHQVSLPANSHGRCSCHNNNTSTSCKAALRKCRQQHDQQPLYVKWFSMSTPGSASSRVANSRK